MILKYSSTLLVGLALLSAGSAHAAVLVAGTEIGVDFGPTTPTNNFNQVNPDPAADGSLAAGTLIDTTNVSVDGVGFSWSTDRVWFNNSDSLEYAAQPAVFNDSNTTDWMGISGGDRAVPGIITLTLTGLNDSLTYDLVIGARFGDNIANTSWTVDGQTLLADATSDTNAYRFFTGLSTDGAGNLVMTGSGATNRLDIATVSALHLTAVPEPSAALLGALGLLVLLRRRRS